jgi:hypothetical protein
MSVDKLGTALELPVSEFEGLVVLLRHCCLRFTLNVSEDQEMVLGIDDVLGKNRRIRSEGLISPTGVRSLVTRTAGACCTPMWKGPPG